MSVWAIIPAKCFDRAKSRLAPVASEEKRQAIAEEMFRHVLGVATTHPALAGTLVVTDCDTVDRVAREAGARVTRDAHPGQLGASLDAALREPPGASAAIILMGDLPLITAADVGALAAQLDRNSAVIAPDRADEGTNALAVRLPSPTATAFGRYGSFSEHVRRFPEAAIYRSATIAFDVDTPDDFVRTTG